MERRTKLFIAAAALGAVATAGLGIAAASDTGSAADDADVHITGPDVERAAAAALAQTGGGRVTDTEVGDEESYYEVEVTLDDGTQVDVQLDEQFNYVPDTPDEGPDSGEDDD